MNFSGDKGLILIHESMKRILDNCLINFLWTIY